MLKKIAGALLSAALVSPVIFGTSSAFAQTSESTAPLPIEYWAVRSAMSNVAVSPNGKYVSFMKIQGKDADPAKGKGKQHLKICTGRTAVYYRVKTDTGFVLMTEVLECIKSPVQSFLLCLHCI